MLDRFIAERGASRPRMTMHPIAFHLGPLAVHWYGVMAALGYLASVLVMLRLRKHAGLEAEQVFDLSMITIIGGLLGARVFYVIQFWSRDGFASDPLMILRIDKGGLVFYGGFICAIVGILIYCMRKKFSILKVMDIMAPGLAAGHAFGRIGCFLQGCCFGKPSELPWAVTFPQGTLPAIKFPDISALPPCSSALHPVQLYECVANIVLFGVLFMLAGRMKAGRMAALYLIGYGVVRLSTEFFRGDHTDFAFGVFTPSQTISLFFLIPFGMLLFVLLGRRKDAGA